MDETQQGLQVNSAAIFTGLILAAVGSLLGLAGLVIGLSALVAAARRWVNQLEQAPSEMAKTKWQQLRAAGSAGAGAWRDSAASPTGAPAGE